jgi:amidophosphoribosyltransferase
MRAGRIRPESRERYRRQPSGAVAHTTDLGKQQELTWENSRSPAGLRRLPPHRVLPVPLPDQFPVSPTLAHVPRGDGRLNHDILPGEKGPQDACGVFGVWAPGEEVAKLTYFGLYALQHRGQESAGIAVSNGSQILVFKDMGLVSQVFDEGALTSLQGHIAVGHARYSTTGASVWENAQPTFRASSRGSIALGHNGNLVNTVQLAEMVADLPRQDSRSAKVAATNDTDLITALLAGQTDDEGNPLTVEQASLRVLPEVRGAFSLVYMDEHTLYAARDPQGIRPLALGRLERGWVVASETSALDICGASYVRDVEPGEFVAIDENGIRTQRFAEAKPKGCVFEYVYLARPDSDIAGRNVHLSRVEMGRRLAKEAPAEADLVIATPESGTPAAIGYAEASGIPFGAGLVKNAYVGRTFIQPSQTIRQLGIRLKLNPLKEVIKGKRLVVVDDSIVRGNTQRALVRMLREAGAAEVHVRISSPPVKWPCFFGIDFATRAELIANGMTVDEVGTSLGADSLAYISLDGMIEATTIAKPDLCRACFDGEYPMELPDPELLGKQLLETELAAGTADTAAADAIRRP